MAAHSLTVLCPADCYNGSDYGLGYNGSVSHTVTGSQCVRWVDTNTSYTDKRYPELSKAGNGCRNPGQWRETPWCFTADGGVELCGVESCDSHSECVGVCWGGGRTVQPLSLCMHVWC